MILRVPSYYKEFRCTADRCADSCCIGWELDIDEDTAAYYEQVKGAFGDRLREHMVFADGCRSFALLKNRFCPFLNRQGLCDICIELGEEALCEVCTEFPRFTIEYENTTEKVLSLACEEVGRLIFSSDQKIGWEAYGEPEDSSEQDWEEDERPAVEAHRLETVRERSVSILQDRSKGVFERAAEYLRYCEKQQKNLYGAGESSVTEQWEENETQAYADFLGRLRIYDELEVLDEKWLGEKELLASSFGEENYRIRQKQFLKEMKEREYEYEQLLVYFTNRYLMRAYYDANLLQRAKFAVLSVLMIRDMDVARWVRHGKFSKEDRIDTAKIYAREVEHSEENMEFLADTLQFEELFETERLLLQL